MFEALQEVFTQAGPTNTAVLQAPSPKVFLCSAGSEDEAVLCSNTHNLHTSAPRAVIHAWVASKDTRRIDRFHAIERQCWTTVVPRGSEGSRFSVCVCVCEREREREKEREWEKVP